MIDQKSDYAYTGYFDDAKKNRFIKEATHKGINFQVMTNDRITIQSNLFGIYKSEAPFTPVSNTLDLRLGSAGVSDYYQMMNVQMRFVRILNGISITGASNTSPIRLELSANTNLSNQEQVIVAGVNGNTNANGTRYVERLRPNRVALYLDENLYTPIAGNGLFTTSNATISRVIYNHGKDFHSGRKFSKLNAPTVHNPFYELADGLLKIYPLNEVCSQVKLDYVSLPVYIDVTDNALDLEQTYSVRFLNLLADETIKMMSDPLHSPWLLTTSSSNIIQP